MRESKRPEIIRVTAAILAKDGRILIAKRRANDRLADKWEFAGGKIEENETPEECLKRELKEEFNIEVTVGQYIGSSTYQYEHGLIELLAYRTFWEDGNISLKDHDDFRWVSVDQLSEYDFAPADLPFVDKLRRGDIQL
mgnify:FL=1